MSFLGKLGKALLMGGGAALAPLTGGASLAATLGAAGIGAGTSLLNDITGAGGEAIGKATTAAGQNRLTQEELALQANQQNVQGLSEFERRLLARAELEDRQRDVARRNAYRASVAGGATNPVLNRAGGTTAGSTGFSPYNPRPQFLSPAFLSDMANVGNAASSRLAAPQRYSVAEMPELGPYVPLDIRNLQRATGTEKGTLEKVGDWAGPISSVLSRLLRSRGGMTTTPTVPAPKPGSNYMNIHYGE